MPRQKWAAIPEETKAIWAENVRLAKLRKRQETAYRREQRRKLGEGRHGSYAVYGVKCSRDTRRKLKALANARRQLSLLQDSDVNSSGYRFSMTETLRLLVESAHERKLSQLEELAEREPRARVILDRFRMTGN